MITIEVVKKVFLCVFAIGLILSILTRNKHLEGYKGLDFCHKLFNLITNLSFMVSIVLIIWTW